MNIAIAVLVWLMIYPIMLNVDFTARGGSAHRPKGLAVAVAITLFGPASGGALAWVVGVLEEVPVMLSVWRIHTNEHKLQTDSPHSLYGQFVPQSSRGRNPPQGGWRFGQCAKRGIEASWIRPSPCYQGNGRDRY